MYNVATLTQLLRLRTVQWRKSFDVAGGNDLFKCIYLSFG